MCMVQQTMLCYFQMGTTFFLKKRPGNYLQSIVSNILIKKLSVLDDIQYVHHPAMLFSQQKINSGLKIAAYPPPVPASQRFVK